MDWEHIDSDMCAMQGSDTGKIGGYDSLEDLLEAHITDSAKLDAVKQLLLGCVPQADTLPECVTELAAAENYDIKVWLLRLASMHTLQFASTCKF